MHTDKFNQWFDEGHQFVRTVCRIAVQLHGDDEKKITETVDEEINKKDKESIINNGVNMVTEFLAGADLFRIRKQNNMAAFMLHQAAEHALHTILNVTTGLHLNTHNIDKLIRYCSMVSYKLLEIFARNNEKNERLFQLFQKAYVNSRYNKDYSICTDDLIVITERVRNLKIIIQGL